MVILLSYHFRNVGNLKFTCVSACLNIMHIYVYFEIYSYECKFLVVDACQRGHRELLDHVLTVEWMLFKVLSAALSTGTLKCLAITFLLYDYHHNYYVSILSKKKTHSSCWKNEINTLAFYFHKASHALSIDLFHGFQHVRTLVQQLWVPAHESERFGKKSENLSIIRGCASFIILFFGIGRVLLYKFSQLANQLSMSDAFAP